MRASQREGNGRGTRLGLSSADASGLGVSGAGREFVAGVEAVSRGIRDPVAKLRFIRASIEKGRAVERGVSRIPFSPLRRWIQGWLGLEAIWQMIRSNGVRTARPTAAFRRSLASRRIAMAGGLAIAAAGLFGAHRVTQTAISAATAWPSSAPVPAAKAPVADSLPVLPKGISPKAIWIVERGEGWEQYSNGLRIETGHAVPGDPRAYRTVSFERGQFGEWRDRPAGVLFHTSESDIWPLDAAHNENLTDSSQRLLRYLKRNKVYNYLIDPFGRTFRVVEEESKANHAGHSIWSHGDQVYLSLNNAFLGVCFESRWEGGRALPITDAQLATGRSLLDYLRHRWGISPEMCVAHGLTSVNAAKHLIGHHLDWSRGFPFAAYGLPDQYARMPPSVELFGFGHDEHLVDVLGAPWPGVTAAEARLSELARKQGRTVEDLRRERQGLYDRWVVQQSEKNGTAGSSSTASESRGVGPGRAAPSGDGPSPSTKIPLTKGSGARTIRPDAPPRV
jgi:hypothetical protein